MQTLKNFIFVPIIFVIALAVFSGCNDKTNKTEAGKESEKKAEPKKEVSEQKKSEAKEDSIKYAPQSEDELMSKNIANFLVNDFAKIDLKGMEVKDRKFQMYKIDLNGDGKDEYFIRLFGTYFCGSGGCTFLLIDRYSEKIATFTVTDAPIFVSSEKENGWNVLYLLSDGKYRKVVHGKKSYPANPSVLPPSDFKPGANDVALFDDAKNPCRTYDF